ncbi:hypothetical protein SIN8267_02090 [Sinobacterium norvegicum]|uniref:Signal peptidase I n=1 Tax=Sinobacterium norvegicum TaxID=1641715 RepID=A0ABN8EJQ8_9GAMM|nr:hypothetical protein SIN8267_02090 [Sinobacterium norvegicum]
MLGLLFPPLFFLRAAQASLAWFYCALWMSVPLLQWLLYRQSLPLISYFYYYPALMAVALTHRLLSKSQVGRAAAFGLPLVLMVVALVVSNALVHRYVGQLYQVQSLSMAPGIGRNDVVRVENLSPLWRFIRAQPSRGQLPVASKVLFYSPPHHRFIIKRVVAVAGDKVAFSENELWVNNVKVEAVFSQKNKASTVYRQRLFDVTFSIIEKDSGSGLRGGEVVPAGHYFVIGDNRDNSVDSREFGSIDQQYIVGIIR